MKATALRYGVLLLCGLLLLAVLAFPSLAAAYVVEPVAMSVWAVWRIIASVHQGVYWILLVVLCALLIIRVFSTCSPAEPLATQRPMEKQRTRVEHWQALFRLAARTQGGDAALRRSLRNLLASTIAQADRPADGGLHEALAARHISLPPSMQEYLGIRPPSATPAGRGPSLSLRIVTAVRRRLDVLANRNQPAIEEILRWMEAATEISHDN